MLKPYAESTLKKKYRATGIDPDVILQVQDYIDACANFYYVLELDEAWKIIRKRVHITRRQFDALIDVICRDERMDAYIVPESEFFADGDDSRYIVSCLYLCEQNGDCDLRGFIEHVRDESDYDGPSPLIEDWEKIYPLLEQRAGKPLYVPDNLLDYCDEEYYEETPQTEAVRRFLEEHIREPEDFDVPDKEDFKRFLVEQAMSIMVEVIKDASVQTGEALNQALDACEACCGSFSRQELQTLANLFMQMNNNTRMPINKGHKPNELYIGDGGMPQRIEFGPGMRKALRDGDLDPDAFRSDVMVRTDWPLELRESFSEEIDKALLKPGEEKWIGGTVIKGADIGPNDPCPCGSGRKYKKCCGRK